MKKNKMMRTASGLLVATLLTTSAISGTFAKYTTEGSKSDQAKVAKWGITVAASGNLFGTGYAKTGADNGDSISTTVNENTVNAGNNVVAPGTKNEEGFTVKIAGTPEVAYSIVATSNDVKDIFLGAGDWGVMVEAEGLNAASDVQGLYTEAGGTYTKVESGSWIKGTTYYRLMNHVEVTDAYYPIQWEVKEGGSAIEISTTSNLSDIVTEMCDGLNVSSKDPGAAADDSYTLTWKWPFDSQKDGADTILGNLQVGNRKVVYAGNGTNLTAEGTYTAPTEGNYNLDVSFNMTVTATQVD